LTSTPAPSVGGRGSCIKNLTAGSDPAWAQVAQSSVGLALHGAPFRSCKCLFSLFLTLTAPPAWDLHYLLILDHRSFEICR
jgi:hypothetical protein